MNWGGPIQGKPHTLHLPRMQLLSVTMTQRGKVCCFWSPLAVFHRRVEPASETYRIPIALCWLLVNFRSCVVVSPVEPFLSLRLQGFVLDFHSAVPEMEVVCAKMHGVSETMGHLKWNGRPITPTPAVDLAPGATQDSLMKLIFDRQEKMSKSLDRLEESLQRKGRWPRRRRRRGHVRCHPLSTTGPHSEALQGTSTYTGGKTPTLSNS